MLFNLITGDYGYKYEGRKKDKTIVLGRKRRVSSVRTICRWLILHPKVIVLISLSTASVFSLTSVSRPLNRWANTREQRYCNSISSSYSNGNTNHNPTLRAWFLAIASASGLWARLASCDWPTQSYLYTVCLIHSAQDTLNPQTYAKTVLYLSIYLSKYWQCQCVVGVTKNRKNTPLSVLLQS